MSEYLYTGGICISTGLIYIFSTDAEKQEIDHTIIASGDGNSFKIIAVLPWKIRGWYECGNRVYMVGEDSQYCIYSENEKVDEGTLINNGVYTGASNFEGNNFVYGMGDLVLLHNGKKDWVLHNKGISKDHFGTEEISCNNQGDCYLVGWRGAVYSLQNNIWIDEEAPTNVILTSCVVTDDGTTYICGKDGVIMKGKKGQWEVLEHDYLKEDFWGLISFGNDIIVASTTNIFKVKSDKLIPILGWPLSEFGVFSSFMRVPNGYWVFSEKKTFKYISGEWL